MRSLTAAIALLTILSSPQVCPWANAQDFSGATAIPDTADWNSADSPAQRVTPTQFSGIAPPLFTPLRATPVPQAGRPDTDQATQPFFARARMTPRRRRLSRVPDMFGDTFLPPVELTALEAVNNSNGFLISSSIVTAGGSARTKIGEHNKALPVDRFYLNYNHFHNAINRDAIIAIMNSSTERRVDGNVDRFVLGMERTLNGGDASLELRLPLSSVSNPAIQDLGGPPGADLSGDTGVVGNLSAIWKKQLVDVDHWIVSAGLGVDVPTGSEASVLVNQSIYTVGNQAWFLHPFVAASSQYSSVFFHSFLQLDLPVADNDISVDDAIGLSPLGKIDTLSPQALLHWDAAAGYWLCRRPDSRGLSGLAALVEFHLTTALESPDEVSGLRVTPSGDSLFVFESSRGRFTSTYITAGLHAEVAGDWTLRVAAVAPLKSGNDRFFDAEVVAQASCRY